jgi:hypothetical protein
MTMRWSDNDHYLGPLTYARNKRYRPLALVLSSGDGDDYPGCGLRLSGFGHTLIVALPPIIRPWRRKVIAQGWDAATVERLGRDWYWDSHERAYGFSYSEGFLQVFLGRQTHDSSTTQDWCKHLPWTQWRHVRRSLYGLEGEHFWTEPQGANTLGSNRWEEVRKAEEACPSRTFPFEDFDRERLTARTQIEEREWHFGVGWFKWLSLFRKPKISRSLNIEFSGETGKRKGSWKGGTIGHSIEMLPGELHEAAFRRYCAQHEMRFGEPPPFPCQPRKERE